MINLIKMHVECLEKPEFCYVARNKDYINLPVKI